MLRLIGSKRGPGSYNILIYCISCLLNCYVGFHHVGLSSMYGISAPYSCHHSQATPPFVNASSQLGSNSTGRNYASHIADASQCTILIKSNGTGEKRIKCNSWVYTYPHGALKSWVNEWNLLCDRTYIVSISTSMYMAGVMIGSPLTGIISDHFGRRPTLLVCLGTASVLSMSMAFIPNLIVLIVIRFLAGFFLAGVHGIAYIIPTEITAKKHMSVVTIIVMNCFILGALIGSSVAYAVKYWRMAQIALTIPGFVCFILAYIWLPELPRWCLTHNKYEKYQLFFMKAVKFNRVNGKDCEDLKSCLMQNQVFMEENKKNVQGYTTADVFRTPRIRKRTLLCMFIWFTSGISYYALILNMRNISDNPFLATLISATTDVPSFLLGFIYIPRLGKRWSIVMVMSIGGLFCLIYPICRYLVVLLIGKSCVAVSLGLVFIYLPDIYPTVIRNIGVGIVGLFLRLGGILAPILVWIGSNTSTDAPTIVVGCLALISGILAVFCPEVKGMKLPDTIEEVEGDKTQEHAQELAEKPLQPQSHPV